MGKVILGAVVGACGGALAGAFLGFGEASLVTWTSAAAGEYWLFLFAVLAYGFFGALFGVAAAVLWQVMRRGKASDFEAAQLGAGLGLLPFGLFVSRYHVAKRIFNEQLTFSTSGGVLAYVLILLGVLLAALLIVGLVRILYRRIGWLGLPTAFGTLVGLAALIGVLFGESGAESVEREASGADGRPNIVLIIADTLRADSTAERARQSPDGGLAQVRRDGVVFETALAQASWTRPSVASILTSQIPSSHGTVHKMDFMSDRILTLAEALRDAGYWTAGITTNINVAPIFNLSQGFGEFDYLEPSFYFGASDSAAKLVIYKTLRTLRERFFANRVFFEHFYQDGDVVNRRVKEWLAEKPPEPFFLFLHFMDPHDPYFEIPYNGRGVARVTNPSPAAERAGELRDLYLQGVRYLDDQLAILIDSLKEAGVYERSALAFTADHGEELYEHRGWWHGTTLYEEQLRVPLIIKQPGNRGAGSIREDPVRSIDIAPTLLGAAGVRAPAPFQGVDILRRRVEEPVIAEEDLEGNRIFSIREGPWKLIVANAGNPRGLKERELYNLAADPDEQKNLAASKVAKVKELEAKLRAMLPPGSF